MGEDSRRSIWLTGETTTSRKWAAFWFELSLMTKVRSRLLYPEVSFTVHLARLGEAHGHALAVSSGSAGESDPHPATSGARICSSSAAPVTPSRRRMTLPSISITRVGTTLIR